MVKRLSAAATFVIAAFAIVAAQDAPPGARGGRGESPVPQFASPDVGAERKVTFRIYAPQARAIRLAASDIPGVGQNAQLTRADNGVWQLTYGPIDSGTYRYNF